MQALRQDKLRALLHDLRDRNTTGIDIIVEDLFEAGFASKVVVDEYVQVLKRAGKANGFRCFTRTSAPNSPKKTLYQMWK